LAAKKGGGHLEEGTIKKGDSFGSNATTNA
jgi:hypothetical protein